jgi:hypothetical protein
MKSEKGKLVKQGKIFLVNLPTKKGTTNFQISEHAKRFRDADASDGLEVDVEKDDANRITKVTIPGKAESTPVVTRPPEKKHSAHRANHQGGSSQLGQQRARRELVKAPAKSLGMEFHNPYTFIPFPKHGPERHSPTLHSVDEASGIQRYTGVMRLAVTTESPLLTSDPEAVENPKTKHKTYRALTIGRDVIVPATGIRGALRSLLTILTGGTLGYLNTSEMLCQGRDLNLGPEGAKSPPGTPKDCFLAEVLTPGNARRAGSIQIGVKRFVALDDLVIKFRNLDEYRSPSSPSLWVEMDSIDQVKRVFESPTEPTGNVWRLRLSGRPVKIEGKREALYRPTNLILELPPSLWGEYSERNKHGDRTDLRKGDLIWLMPKNPNATAIRAAEDIDSLQWARWGRRGQNLQELIQKHHAHVMPDSLKDDGKVDTVTDMFGQVPVKREFQAPSFAGRVLPENLVFPDAASRVHRLTLAPLAPPHPGCVAFYRDNANADGISMSDGLRGYKVYRTTEESGDDAPWKFSMQGVYGDRGELKDANGAVNKTCDLVPQSERGWLNITFTALSELELALLIQACSVPWRLGGGKPLGLGKCSVEICDLLDETGELLQVAGWEIERGADAKLHLLGWQRSVQPIAGCVAMWVASQSPVKRLRYPRAVDETRHKKSRGGHVWFQRHAQPRAVVDKDGNRQPGLNPMYVDGELMSQVQSVGGVLDPQEPMIAGQPLPTLNVADPQSDRLFGYDGFGVEVQTREKPKRRVYIKYEPFDPTKHARETDKSSGNDGKDKAFRENNKRRE